MYSDNLSIFLLRSLTNAPIKNPKEIIKTVACQDKKVIIIKYENNSKIAVIISNGETPAIAA